MQVCFSAGSNVFRGCFMRGTWRSRAFLLPLIATAALLVASCGARQSSLPANSGSAGSGSAQALQATGLPASLPDPPPTCGYCSNTLVHKTPEQLGQFALDYANNHLDPHGPVQVLLLRYVRAEDFPALGLGCPPSFGAVEQPPLLLAVYKGDIDKSREIIGMHAYSVDGHGKQSYALYIFDMWAAEPTIMQGSSDGSNLRQLLSDPTLPTPQWKAEVNCAAPEPGTLHYGNTAPAAPTPSAIGLGAPPPTPTAVPQSTSTAVSAPPQPVSTAPGSAPRSILSDVP